MHGSGYADQCGHVIDRPSRAPAHHPSPRLLATTRAQAHHNLLHNSPSYPNVFQHGQQLRFTVCRPHDHGLYSAGPEVPHVAGQHWLGPDEVCRHGHLFDAESTSDGSALLARTPTDTLCTTRTSQALRASDGPLAMARATSKSALYDNLALTWQSVVRWNSMLGPSFCGPQAFEPHL